MRTTIVKLLVCFLALLGPLSQPVMAQPETFVIVPDHPQGVPINGCYRANQTLFGPYQFSFCFHRPGTYQVRGGGVRCDGRMDWRGAGRDIHADIRRASCGGGVAWEAAFMECRPAGRILGPVGALFISSLRCTYHPTVRFKARRTFTASRL